MRYADDNFEVCTAHDLAELRADGSIMAFIYSTTRLTWHSKSLIIEDGGYSTTRLKWHSKDLIIEDGGYIRNLVMVLSYRLKEQGLGEHP